jgi:hypothetical protein
MVYTVTALAAIVSAMALTPAAAQARYEAALSAGRAFMIDVDDPDPAGSHSITGSLERRQPRSGLSLGVEGGVHRYLTMRQDLPPDVTGWSSRLEDTRQSWRVTPFVRWGTRGDHVRLYGQLGAGLYLQRYSYFQQERQEGVLVVDTRRRATEATAGMNLGVGLELFPGKVPIGVTAGFRTHLGLGGGDGFNTGEVGVVYGC